MDETDKALKVYEKVPGWVRKVRETQFYPKSSTLHMINLLLVRVKNF